MQNSRDSIILNRVLPFCFRYTAIAGILLLASGIVLLHLEPAKAHSFSLSFSTLFTQLLLGNAYALLTGGLLILLATPFIELFLIALVSLIARDRNLLVITALLIGMLLAAIGFSG